MDDTRNAQPFLEAQFPVSFVFRAIPLVVVSSTATMRSASILEPNIVPRVQPIEWCAVPARNYSISKREALIDALVALKSLTGSAKTLVWLWVAKTNTMVCLKTKFTRAAGQLYPVDVL